MKDIVAIVLIAIAYPLALFIALWIVGKGLVRLVLLVESSARTPQPASHSDDTPQGARAGWFFGVASLFLIIGLLHLHELWTQGHIVVRGIPVHGNAAVASIAVSLLAGAIVLAYALRRFIRPSARP